MARTGLAYSPKMIQHYAGAGHSECPERLTAITKALARAQLDLVPIPITPATKEDLLRIHAPEHVAEIESVCEAAAVYRDPDTQMVPGSWEAALLAAGAVISACRAVLDDTVDNAFCPVRPPGHHAERDVAMGFCLFNNVAVAARWLQRVAGVGRIAIFDWDVHHGNGTQHAFYDDPTVFFASIHQHPHYPGTGWPSERGAENTNLNIQMKRGEGSVQWMEALDTLVLPALAAFAPDFLLISAGFDTHRLDPLGDQELESSTYEVMTQRLRGLAGGRMVSVLEGGYHLQALGESVVAHVRALRSF